jgi:nucleotide-binding universal stress UspA family protein
VKIEKILVGVDLSPGSDAAVAQAMNVARHTGASVCLFHAGVIVDDPTGIPDSMAGTAAAYLKIVKDQLAADRSALEALRERLSGQGVEVSHMVADGFADTAIRDAAGELHADLVVIGTHGRTGLKRFLLGSVAERVVRIAPCSVLVVRPAEPAPGYRRILVATDFSPSAAGALEMAAAVALPDARIDLVHCWELPLPLDVGPAASMERAYAEARSGLREQIDASGARIMSEQAPGLALRFHQVEAPPRDGILDWLEQHPADLVVTGSHGRRGVRRFVLGSVAESTVRHAPCSVLVARPRGG